MKLQSNKARVVSLVMYSQADMSIVLNRRKLADFVVGEFNRGYQHSPLLGLLKRKTPQQRLPLPLSLEVR